MRYRTLARRVGDAVRLAEVIQILAKYGFSDIIHRLGLHEGMPAKVLRSLHLISKSEKEGGTLSDRLNSALSELGPTFVKLGQILSTRPDLVGRELSRGLGSLQDKVKPVPFDEMKVVLESSLAAPLEEVFQSFDETPIAAASISQVYRATLRNGHAVAVKVQRPKIRAIVDSDVSLLRGIAEWISENVEDLDWFDSVGTIDEFDRSIHRELDFSIEASTIDRFHANFRDTPYVEIPRTYEQACSAQVLTMDWMDGVRIDSVDDFGPRNCNPKTVARYGCEALFKQVFEHHFFHADPHPGNIFVTRHSHIAFIDYGMVGHLERSDLDAMVDLLRAVLRQDSKAAVHCTLKLTVAENLEDTTNLEHEVADFLAFEATSILRRGQVGRALERITEILGRHEMQLAPRFSLLIKALATIESTARILDPTMDLIPIIKPYIENFVKRRYGLDELFREGQENFFQLIRLGRELPSEVHQLLQSARRGKAKIQLNHVGLDRLTHVLDTASNRIAFSVITGSLIVGSSLLLTTDIGGRTLGYIGFSFAGFVGVALLISILRSRKY